MVHSPWQNTWKLMLGAAYQLEMFEFCIQQQFSGIYCLLVAASLINIMTLEFVECTPTF
jgi:hypothetical protein